MTTQCEEVGELDQQHLNDRLKRETVLGKLTARYFTPIVVGFDRLTRLNINPNYVTFFNSIVIATCVICVHYHWYILAGIVIFVSLWLDGYDGALARRLNRTSRAGSVFDVVNDKFKDLLIGIALFWTTDNTAIRMIALLYAPIAILYSYVRTLCSRMVSTPAYLCLVWGCGMPFWLWRISCCMRVVI